MLCLSRFELYSRWVPLPHAGVSFRGVDHKVVCEEGGKTTPLETLSGRLLS